MAGVKNRSGTGCTCDAADVCNTYQLHSTSDWTATSGSTISDEGNGWIGIDGGMTPNSTSSAEAYKISFQVEGEISVVLDGETYSIDQPTGSASLDGNSADFLSGTASVEIRITPTHAHFIVQGTDDFGGSNTTPFVGTVLTVDRTGNPPSSFEIQGASSDDQIKNLTISDSHVVYSGSMLELNCYSPSFPIPHAVFMSSIQDDTANYDFTIQTADASKGIAAGGFWFPSIARTDSPTPLVGGRTDTTISGGFPVMIQHIAEGTVYNGEGFVHNDYRHNDDSSHMYNSEETFLPVYAWKTRPSTTRYLNAAKGVALPLEYFLLNGIGFDTQWGAFLWDQYFEHTVPAPHDETHAIASWDSTYHATSATDYEYLAYGAGAGGTDFHVDGEAYYYQDAPTSTTKYPKPILRARLRELGSDSDTDETETDYAVNSANTGFTMNTTNVQWDA